MNKKIRSCSVPSSLSFWLVKLAPVAALPLLAAPVAMAQNQAQAPAQDANNQSSSPQSGSASLLADAGSGSSGFWAQRPFPPNPLEPADTNSFDASKSFSQPSPQPTPPPNNTTPAPNNTTPPPESTSPPNNTAPIMQPTMPPMTSQSYRFRRNQIYVSGDFKLGNGYVTMPVGYSLDKSLGAESPKPVVTAIKPTRSSVYYGASVSYSYGQQAWYLDFSYSHGNSSGNQQLDFENLGSQGTGSFKIDDDWYQGYIRYAFPQLRGKALSAYLRAGVTYIDSTLDNVSALSASGYYTQTDNAHEIRGNLGAGATYAIYPIPRFRVGLTVEGEGFGGYRDQDSLETFTRDSGNPPQSATINNTVYGMVGRGLVHLEYKFGRSRNLGTFLDAGMEADYTWVEYPQVGTLNELLWGPYVKVGLNYSF